MANSYFQFKKFRIEQGKCAMKVCTDSCLFGAFIEVAKADRILDIGTGTGLLALMVAQRSEAYIDAVEINPDAAEQAKENFTNSPWGERLNLYPVSLQNFSGFNDNKYDIILTNPPFFLSSLRSGNVAKDTAKHTGELLFDDILAYTKSHLTADGKLYLLLPPFEADHFASIAINYGIYLSHTLKVYTYVGGQCIRYIQTYSFLPVTAPEQQSIDIREEDRTTYTASFRALLKDYYLIF